MNIYCWTSPKKKVHIINPNTDRTWCQIERSSPSTAHRLGRAEQPYPGADICQNCFTLMRRVAAAQAQREESLPSWLHDDT